MNKKLNVLRAGDQNFWAYHWIAKEHSRYTSHNITYAKHNEINLDGIDILYIHSPDITNYHSIQLPLLAKEKGIKVIGGYAGNPVYWSLAEKKTYSYADLIVTISPQTYSFAKFHSSFPTIYLPECVDHNFFTPKKFNKNKCVIGWAGGFHKKIKRGYILEKLNYPVIIKDNWKKQRNSQDKNLTLEEMRDFYKSIDILLVTSASECQPRVILEAMATGIPVISTDVGSVATLIDPEWLVPIIPEAITISAINKRLNILTKYPEVRKQVGIRNREHIEKFFNWNIRQPIWDGIFENLISNNISEIQKLSKSTLFPFKKEFCSRLINWKEYAYSEPIVQLHSINTPTITSFSDLIPILIREFPHNFWLEKTSCADAILYQKLVSTDILYLGVSTPVIFQHLIETLNQINYDKNKLKIQIIDNPNIKQTKIMPFYNCSINVPFPVIEYLQNLYGKDWSKK